jgi:hypothetical protein
MLRRFAIVVSLVVLAAPALASDYWVVQDPSGQKKCSIVEKTLKPGETAPAGSIGPAYQTREEAEAIIERNYACGGSSH